MTVSPEPTPNPDTKSPSQPSDREKNSLVRDLAGVGIAGAVGGVARKCWQIEEQTKNTSEQVNISARFEQANLPTTFWGFWLYAVPLNLFLGGVSAVIGVSLLMGTLNAGKDILRKERFRIIGLSLICGLFFPTIFDLAAESLQASSKISKVEQTAAQNAKQTVNSAEQIAVISNDPQVQKQAIQVQENAINNIESIATNSNDISVQKQAIQVQENAINSAEKIVSSSDDIQVKKQAILVQSNAINNIENIAIKSNDSAVERDAVSQLIKIAKDSTGSTNAKQAINALAKVAIASQEPSIRELAMRSLNNLSPQMTPELQDEIQQAIAEIKSQSNP